VRETDFDYWHELSNRIIVIPFGISKEKPVQKRNLMKQKIPNYKEDDFLMIWGGGIWNWFDTDTLIEGMKILKSDLPNLKLFFMSAPHPHPAMPKSQHQLLYQTIEKTKEYDLFNKTVFFNDKWIPYNERCDYLLDADIGISTHHNHLETRFAFRTRILDYIWCNLPIISTKGDYLSELIDGRDLGLTIDEGDRDELVNAISTMVEDKRFVKKCRKNLDKISLELRWETLLKPLVRIIESPSKIPFSSNEKENFLKYHFLDPDIKSFELNTSNLKSKLYYLKHEGFGRLKNLLKI